ncbi:hypothetical protein QZH41_011694 [Actinostola sp. cb2023]|nr:hypothetical protein QZH41_011694 [Actinostola sp. cb2023]
MLQIENYPEILISMIQKAQHVGGKVSDIVNSRRNVDDQTALDVACHFSQEKGVKMLLLEAGADKGYQKPIHTALKSNGTRRATFILEFDPEQIDEKDLKYGAFPLHWAKSKEAVRLLLKSGANIECKNNDDETPLHVMARRRRLGCVIALLSSGADVNPRSNNGSTPLHIAAQADDCDIVRALIVFGADVNVTNNNHHTSRHIATKDHHPRWKGVVEALCYVGASPCDKQNCNLSCSKEFKGQLRIGKRKLTHCKFHICGYGLLGVQCYPYSGHGENGQHPPVLDYCTQLPIQKQCRKIACLSSLFVCFQDSKSKPKCTKSIFKEKNGRDSVLTMDGGGIRGLVLIQLLLAIEELTGEPITGLFDWIGGTSTGGILALALLHGKSVRYCQGLYFTMKDEVFNGPRPYNSEPLERFLREQFGENATMTSVTHPKTLVTSVLADRRPATLYFFRNYDMPEEEPATAAKSPFPSPPSPSVQQVWRAARGTGAAPTFFRAMGRFLDGALIANNPTLDVMTEIHKYYKVHDPDSHKSSGSSNIGIVVSLGTGVPPTEHVMNIDVFKPDSIWDATNSITGARALGILLVDQACATHGAVVERARVWCEMIGVPFYRLSSDISVEVGLDETDDKLLVKMLWETKVYVLQHFKEFKELSERLTS